MRENNRRHEATRRLMEKAATLEAYTFLPNSRNRSATRPVIEGFLHRTPHLRRGCPNSVRPVYLPIGDPQPTVRQVQGNLSPILKVCRE